MLANAIVGVLTLNHEPRVNDNQYHNIRPIILYPSVVTATILVSFFRKSLCKVKAADTMQK